MIDLTKEEAALEEACRFIAEVLYGDSCPYDCFDEKMSNCSHENCVPIEHIWMCWKEYFIRAVTL